MKILRLFCLIILLCFGSTSCESVLEMMAVKTIEGDICFLFPINDKVELRGTLEEYEFELPQIDITQERKKEFQEEYPQISIFEEKEDFQFYCFLLHSTVSTRKDFVIDIILQTDDKKYFGKIGIPYLNSEGGTTEFEILSEDDEKINGILIYNFIMSI